MQHLDPRDQILIDPQAFSWVSQLEVKPAQKIVPASLEREIAAPSAPLLSMIDKKLSPPKRVKKSVARNVLRDSIQQVQAAPAKAAVSAEAHLASELRAMKQMHRALHRGFRTALLAPVVPAAPALATQPALVSKPKHLVATQAKKPLARKKSKPILVAQSPIAAKTIEIPTKPSLPAGVQLRDEVRTVISQATEATVEDKPAVLMAISPETTVVHNIQLEPALPPSPPKEEQPNLFQGNAPEMVATEASSQSESITIDQGVRVAAAAPTFGYPYSFDYPQPTVVVSDYSPNVQPPTPAPSPSAPAPSPTPPGALCVQAFHWEAQIDDCYKENLTEEQGVNGEESGWKIAKAYQHWSTLHWKTNKPVPLVSQNTAVLLGTLLKTKVEPQTGIVFGTLPEGWTAEISARAEGFILDSQNEILSADATEGVRYFTFLNTAPGTHLLHLVHRKTARSVAVVVPVVSGTSTFIEGAIPTPITLSGTILDGSASTVAPIAGVSISVIGQEKSKGKTHANGQFVLENLLTVNNYPLFIQSDFEGGYTHRYRVLPGATSNLTLYRLSRHQLDGWMGQLVGGVSPESGLIVGAIPKIVAANEDRLYPAVAPLLANQSLAPETYTVAPSGQLLVNTELSAESARFVAAQIPDGAAIVQVEDPAQKSVWSELVPVSPGVVSLVGPY